MNQVIKIFKAWRRNSQSAGIGRITIIIVDPYLTWINDLPAFHNIVQPVSNLPAISVKKQVAARIAAQDAVIKVILLYVLNSKFRVTFFKMEQGAIGVARYAISMAENPVVVMHGGLGG